MIFNTGRYCLGVRCNHPDAKLWPSHKCPICNEIVHTQCRKFNTKHDKVVCNFCIANENEVTEDEESLAEVDLTGNASSPIVATNDAIMEMTVSVEPMNEEFTTITDSVAANKKIKRLFPNQTPAYEQGYDE